ncbi:hypothetical protein EGW08_019125 [Elysia chlorotica]|uniref:Uncharacterized protein n=1 Tax=Elysia chlorotica TaxID=188477 RepID=A0A3S0ZQR5_ELYCH|nr:hypothetical protein EGW08_019125 [Elysia chlorotica]
MYLLCSQLCIDYQSFGVCLYGLLMYWRLTPTVVHPPMYLLCSQLCIDYQCIDVPVWITNVLASNTHGCASTNASAYDTICPKVDKGVPNLIFQMEPSGRYMCHYVEARRKKQALLHWLCISPSSHEHRTV